MQILIVTNLLAERKREHSPCHHYSMEWVGKKSESDYFLSAFEPTNVFICNRFSHIKGQILRRKLFAANKQTNNREREREALLFQFIEPQIKRWQFISLSPFHFSSVYLPLLIVSLSPFVLCFCVARELSKLIERDGKVKGEIANNKSLAHNPLQLSPLYYQTLSNLIRRQ